MDECLRYSPPRSAAVAALSFGRFLRTIGTALRTVGSVSERVASAARSSFVKGNQRDCSARLSVSMSTPFQRERRRITTKVMSSSRFRREHQELSRTAARWTDGCLSIGTSCKHTLVAPYEKTKRFITSMATRPTIASRILNCGVVATVKAFANRTITVRGVAASITEAVAS
jgi:hypothetical protein